MKNIEIIDYSLLDLVAVVSIDSETPEPNTFTFNFTKGDVAAAAVELGIISQPWDFINRKEGPQIIWLKKLHGKLVRRLKATPKKILSSIQ